MAAIEMLTGKNNGDIYQFQVAPGHYGGSECYPDFMIITVENCTMEQVDGFLNRLDLNCIGSAKFEEIKAQSEANGTPGFVTISRATAKSWIYVRIYNYSVDLLIRNDGEIVSYRKHPATWGAGECLPDYMRVEIKDCRMDQIISWIDKREEMGVSIGQENYNAILAQSEAKGTLGFLILTKRQIKNLVVSGPPQTTSGNPRFVGLPD